MVPNFHSMSQFANRGVSVTKPSISGVNYIRKKSDVQRREWEEVWTAFHWNVISDHALAFRDNHWLSMMPRLLERMDQLTGSRLMNGAELSHEIGSLNWLHSYFPSALVTTGCPRPRSYPSARQAALRLPQRPRLTPAHKRAGFGADQHTAFRTTIDDSLRLHRYRDVGAHPGHAGREAMQHGRY